MAYGTAADAAGISGLDAADISAAMIALADELIDSWMNRDYGFSDAQTVTNELYDIEIDGVDELLLNNWPLITVTDVKNDAQATTPLTLNVNNYEIYLDLGILKLVVPSSSGDTDWVRTFAKGHNSVQASYTYGYAAAPGRIVQLSNVVSARIAKQIKLESERPTGGGESIRIGDFEQRFGRSQTVVQELLTGAEKDLLNACIRDYKVVV